LIFEVLENLADAIAITFGPNCEVAIHDLSELRNSLKYIAGNVTNRKPGAPITDFVIKSLKSEGNSIKNRYRYKTTTKDGKILKSSAIYVRNSKKEVIAVVCINFDVTPFMDSVSIIQNLINTTELESKLANETFAFTVNETLDSIIEQVVIETGSQPSRISKKKDRINFIDLLEDKGLFLMKGAVDHVAMAMGISKYTVYNYLQEIRNSKKAKIIAPS
jgi:predicted transcriptional regulator YheO